MTDPDKLPVLLLAYVGDAVYELYVRAKLVRSRRLPVRAIHRKATGLVRASGQDEALRLLEPYLTDQEADMVRRGRNTKSSVPKNAKVSSYRRATGFEALLGWLYLNGRYERLQELLAIIEIGEVDEQ